jgi:hypothetical protein
MNTQAKTDLTLVASPPRDSALPAGAGIVLAMVLGGLIWAGLFALLT